MENNDYLCRVKDIQKQMDLTIDIKLWRSLNDALNNQLGWGLKCGLSNKGLNKTIISQLYHQIKDKQNESTI